MNPLNPPNRIWVITSKRGDSEPIVYGTYRNGKEAEDGLQRLKNNWPKDVFLLSSYLHEGTKR